MRIYKQKYNVSQAVHRIERLFIQSKYLRGKFYTAWLELTEGDRDRVRRHLRKIVRECVFSKELYEAIAKDILVNEGGILHVAVESNLYEYMKKHVYEGDVRRMLVDMSSIIRGEEMEE